MRRCDPSCHFTAAEIEEKRANLRVDVALFNNTLDDPLRDAMGVGGGDIAPVVPFFQCRRHEQVVVVAGRELALLKKPLDVQGPDLSGKPGRPVASDFQVVREAQTRPFGVLQWDR